MPMRKFLPLLLLLSVQAFSQVDNSLKTSSLASRNSSQTGQLTNIQWDEVEPYVNGFARALTANKFTFLN
jgi:hypothetical protein